MKTISPNKKPNIHLRSMKITTTQKNSTQAPTPFPQSESTPAHSAFSLEDYPWIDFENAPQVRLSLRDGYAALASGHSDQAFRYFHDALRRATASDNTQLQAICFSGIAVVQANLHRWNDAASAAEVAVEMATDSGDVRLIGTLYPLLARVRRNLADIVSVSMLPEEKVA